MSETQETTAIENNNEELEVKISPKKKIRIVSYVNKFLKRCDMANLRSLVIQFLHKTKSTDLKSRTVNSYIHAISTAHEIARKRPEDVWFVDEKKSDELIDAFERVDNKSVNYKSQMLSKFMDYMAWQNGTRDITKKIKKRKSSNEDEKSGLDEEDIAASIVNSQGREVFIPYKYYDQLTLDPKFMSDIFKEFCRIQFIPLSFLKYALSTQPDIDADNESNNEENRNVKKQKLEEEPEDCQMIHRTPPSPKSNVPDEDDDL